jgi:hypothetical protein
MVAAPIIARLRAATHHLDLDTRLAAGERPDASPVRALRSEPAPPVRVIAAVSLLLTDGAGPMFAPHPHGTLTEAAFQAAFLAEAD